jgi:putative membrane protein
MASEEKATVREPLSRNFNSGRILPVSRFANSSAAEWLDESGVHRSAVSRWRGSESGSGSHPPHGEPRGEGATHVGGKADVPTGTNQGAGLSDYLAAERTLLAWIRTGLALMGFGFVVARFGLFLQQLQIAQHAPTVQPYGLSVWFGTALIAAGVLVNLLSGWHHLHLVRSLDQGKGMRPHTTALTIGTALFLALVGIGMAVYLISVRDSANSYSEHNEVSHMSPTTTNGMVSKRSNHSVDETLQKLTRALQAKGVTVFAIVDHSGEAEKVGMEMPPTKVVMFGSPRPEHPSCRPRLASPSTCP